MPSGDATLGYNLYSNASPRVPGLTRPLCDYGPFPARQNARAGNYGDTLIVTVNF